MALKHDSLTDLFSSFADKVRNVTGRPSDLKIDLLPFFVRDCMLGRFIVDDVAIPVTGDYATSTYYNTSYGVKIGYLPNGDVMITAQGGTSTTYEQLLFALADGSDAGITLVESHNTSSSYNTAKAGLIYGCYLSGFDRRYKYKITVEMTARNATGDTATMNLTVTKIPKTSTTVINFTVDGVAYQALDNMTWMDFICSSYEKDNLFDTDGYYVKYNSPNGAIGLLNIRDQYITSLIVDGTAYTLQDGTATTVDVDVNNIGTYFDIENGEDYYFVGSNITFVNNNGGIDSSVATTTLTAKRDMDVFFYYSYSSEANYDKFTLVVADTTIENAVSGAATTKSYTGSLVAGDKIEFTYSKDGSQDGNDDRCAFSTIKVTYID